MNERTTTGSSTNTGTETTTEATTMHDNLNFPQTAIPGTPEVAPKRKKAATAPKPKADKPAKATAKADAKATKPAKKAGAKRGPKPSSHKELQLEVLMAAAGITEISEMSRRAGVSRQTLYTWQDKGLSYWRADELAIKLCGMHPANVFGPVWYALYTDQMAVAA